MVAIMSADNFLFAGSAKAFDELYPHVRSLNLKLSATPMGFGESETWTFSKASIPARMPCLNPSCSGEGIDLSWLVASHIHARKSHDKGSQLCKGREHYSGGSRSCYYTFRYSIDAEYEGTSEQTQSV